MLKDELMRVSKDSSVALRRIVGVLAASGFLFTALLSLREPVTAVAQPPGMIWIPGGKFVMGSDAEFAMANERPAHRVAVKGFWLDEHPVTNEQFGQFVAKSGFVTTAERKPDWEELKKQAPPGTERPSEDLLQPGSLVFTPPSYPVDLRDMSRWWTWTIGASWRHPQGPGSSVKGKERHPVVHISWDDARSFCEAHEKRLPTEAEWEFAARERSTSRYYWGDEITLGGKFMANTFTGQFPHRNSKADGFSHSSPVRAFPANDFGLFDMAGNVWQWTADRYREDAHEYRARGEPMPAGCYNSTRAMTDTEERVIKGGSFLCSPSYCESYRPSARRGTPPDTSSEHVGFRCAK